MVNLFSDRPSWYLVDKIWFEQTYLPFSDLAKYTVEHVTLEYVTIL